MSVGAPGWAGERERGLQALPGRGSPSDPGGRTRAKAERKPPGPAGREVGRVLACWGPGARGWGGPSGCGGLVCGRGRHEAGPRLVLVPAPSLPPLLCREAFGTHSRGPRPHFCSEERFVPPLLGTTLNTHPRYQCRARPSAALLSRPMAR